MPLPRVYKVIQDSLGNVVPQVLCSVLNQGTGVLATLWQNDAGTIPLSNPMTSDATYGSFGFYVDPGHYDLTFTKPGYTFQPHLDMQVPQDDLTLGTMAQQDANAVAITGGTATFGLVTAPRFTAEDSAGEFQTAFEGNKTAGANRWNLFCDGSAVNYLEGALGIGNPAALTSTKLKIWHNKTFDAGMIVQPTVTDTGGAAVVFLNVAGTTVGNIMGSATATVYNTVSDARLKGDVDDLTGELALIQALRPVSFTWIADGSPGVGFLAQEVAALVQGVITGEPDDVDEEGQIRPMQIDMSKLVPWLVGACKTLAARLQATEARLDVLEDALGV